MSLSIDERSTSNPPARFADAVLSAIGSLYLRQAILFGALVFAAYTGIVLVVSIVQPQTDWDVLAYLAVAAERLYPDPAALHAYAYSVLRADLSPAEFALLTEDGGYRSQMYADPNGFVSMLGMYRVKWLYVELLSALSQVMAPLQAVRLISMVSALAFASTALLWLRAQRSVAMAAAFAGILIVSGFADMARAVSPDMLFAALLLAGLFAHNRGREAIAGLLLVVAFLVRPDNVIFLGVYAALLVLYRQWSWGVLAAFIVSAAAFIPLTTITGQPGWWAQLYFASIEHQSTLEGFHPAFSVTLYVTALIKQFLLATTAQTWVGVVILGLAAWAAANRFGRPLTSRNRLLMFGLLAAIAAKFILVPIFDTRIYFPYVVAMFLVTAGQFAAPRRT